MCSLCDPSELVQIIKVLAALLWLDALVIVLCGIATAILASIKPYAHFIFERDPTLSYPYYPAQAVPMWLLGLLAVAFPLVSLVLYALLGYGPEPVFKLKRMLGTDKLPRSMARWVVLLSWAMAMLLCLLFTQGIKVYGGRPRPNFFAMCDYQGYRSAMETGNFTEYNALTIGASRAFVAVFPAVLCGHAR